MNYRKSLIQWKSVLTKSFIPLVAQLFSHTRIEKTANTNNKDLANTRREAVKKQKQEIEQSLGKMKEFLKDNEKSVRKDKR